MTRSLHYTHEGVVLRWQPPYVVHYCRAPRITNADKPCAYPADTCTAEFSTCPWCEFSYCAYHLIRHRGRVLSPPEFFEAWRHRLRTESDRALAARPKETRMHVGSLSLEELPQ